MNYENKTAFVTKRLLDKKLSVGFAYREASDNENDSGWRFFVGDESQEYVDNPDNLVICSIDEIIKLDESIKSILNSEVNTAYEKENMEFKKVDDYDFGENLEN